ncbi:MAG TPA: glycosyltransferase [Gemmatimonadales bacterium]|nr:glycosyltransferase [Gemmatimonadales bacterium]
MSGRPAPIAFFLPSLCGGGAERVVMNLASGMAQRGVSVDLVLAAAEGPLLGQVPAAVRLIDLGGHRVLRSFGPLTRYLRHERPRVLISSMSHANLVAVWAARLAGGTVPVVATVHNTMSQSAREQGRVARALWPVLLRLFYPWASSVVAVSHGAAEDLARTARLPRERVRVIYNPVIDPAVVAASVTPPDHPWFVPGQPPVILGAGRLTEQKDFESLIRGFAEVARCRSARLLILGEGERRASLEALVQELGLAEHVQLPGFRDNVMAYMAASEVFVLSSRWEGLPTVLIEAMAAGTRVVATDCPSGPREILQDGRLGILVPVADPPALASAILRALEAPEATVPSDALTPFTSGAAIDHYLSLIETVR